MVVRAAVGFSGETSMHAVCGWRGDKIILITVYIPVRHTLLTREHEESPNEDRGL